MTKPLPLTDRHRQVLPLIAEGKTDEIIGRKLHLSHNTLRTHVRRMLDRTGAVSREHLVAVAIRAGHLPVEPLPADGLPKISERYMLVLTLLGDGKTTRQIAHQLECSEQAVRQLVARFLGLLRCHNRAHLVMKAFQLGLLTKDGTPPSNPALVKPAAEPKAAPSTPCIGCRSRGDGRLWTRTSCPTHGIPTTATEPDDDVDRLQTVYTSIGRTP